MSEPGLHGQSRRTMEVVEEIHDQEVASGEAHQEHRRLVKEAYAARGGTPLQRLWHRLRRGARREDDTSSSTS